MAGMAGKAPLLASTEEVKAGSDERVADERWARDNMDAEVDRAAVESFPDLVVHLTHLQVALKRAIAPSPDARVVSLARDCLVADSADANPGVEAKAEEAELEQHVPLLERPVVVVDGPHNGGVGKLVIAHQPTGGFPAPIRHGGAGRLIG